MELRNRLAKLFAGLQPCITKALSWLLVIQVIICITVTIMSYHPRQDLCTVCMNKDQILFYLQKHGKDNLSLYGRCRIRHLMPSVN